MERLYEVKEEGKVVYSTTWLSKLNFYEELKANEESKDLSEELTKDIVNYLYNVYLDNSYTDSFSYYIDAILREANILVDDEDLTLEEALIRLVEEHDLKLRMDWMI